MKKKRQYYYIVVFYKVAKAETVEWNASTYLCSTNETNPAGIPTNGYLIQHAKADAERHGGVYVENTLYISSMMKLTKAQYDALMDEEEPKEE